MVSKATINRFNVVRIGYRNRIQLQDIDDKYLNNLKKDELVNFTDELIKHFLYQKKELVRTYKEINDLKKSTKSAKIQKTKTENKLKDVLIDYHLATKKLLKQL